MDSLDITVIPSKFHSIECMYLQCMYVSMHMFIAMCVYACVLVRMRVHDTYVCMCMYVCMHVYVCVQCVCICTYVCMCVYVCLRVCVCMYVCTYVCTLELNNSVTIIIMLVNHEAKKKQYS